VTPAPSPSYVPVVGRIAAGGPILAEEAVEDVFPLPRQLVGEGQLFLLKVVGDSMIDAAICDGDWVVVRQQPTADNGDIVAAMIDGEATVKTFNRRGPGAGSSRTTRHTSRSTAATRASSGR
jgi:repressor LexA